MVSRTLVALAVGWLALLAPAGPSPTRVLFIGNSLTTVNDVPGLLTELATAAHQSLTCRVVAEGGFSLEDHWQKGDAQRAIAQGTWSFVVLQQGPSALPDSQVLLRDYAGRFAALARKVGARPALYMVWPEAVRKDAFAGVHTAYASAAAEVGGLLLPVGDAWLEVWRRDPTVALYGPDGFHPTRLGSYLAAVVMFDAFFGRTPVSLPSLGLEGNQARLLQDAAAATVSRVGLPTGALGQQTGRLLEGPPNASGAKK